MKADTALLEIALDTTLWKMPEGAGFTSSSGRAHVKASVKHGKDGKPPTLVIESGCDSLERLCLKYMSENRQLTGVNQYLKESKQTAVEQRSKSLKKWAWATFFAGIGAGVLTTILIIRIYGSIRRNRPHTEC